MDKSKKVPKKVCIDLLPVSFAPICWQGGVEGTLGGELKVEAGQVAGNLVSIVHIIT